MLYTESNIIISICCIKLLFILLSIIIINYILLSLIHILFIGSYAVSNYNRK